MAGDRGWRGSRLGLDAPLPTAWTVSGRCQPTGVGAAERSEHAIRPDPHQGGLAAADSGAVRHGPNPVTT